MCGIGSLYFNWRLNSEGKCSIAVPHLRCGRVILANGRHRLPFEPSSTMVALVFASHFPRFMADPSLVDQPQSTQFSGPYLGGEQYEG
jgi:hypothetical protein